ncbi:MAG: MATE family efflux transporter [Clostridium sp.]
MNQSDFLDGKISKLYLKYLLPSIGATLVTSIYILADTIMIGRGVGATGIAALNIVLPIFNLFFGTGVLFGVGGGVLFSVYKGRGDEKSAKEYFTAAMVLAAVFSVLYMVIFRVFFEPITRAMGSNDTMRHQVYSYGIIFVTGAPAFIFSSCLQAFVRNDKAPKLSMAAVISGGVINVILDYIFIFPMGMGMAGASLATVISSYITVLILLTHFLNPDNTLKLTKHLRVRAFGKVIINGLSSFLLELTGGIVILMFNHQLLAYVGDLGVVVYAIVSNSALIVASISNGIAQAVQPILAVNFGAGRMERVEQTRKLGLMTTLFAGVLFTGIGLIKPLWLIYAFVAPTEEIIHLGTTAIRIYFLSFLAAGANMLLGTYFQSVLRPMNAFLISLLRGLVFNGIFVMLLPMILGVNGIWITIVITEFLTLIIAGLMMYREKYMKRREKLEVMKETPLLEESL